MRAVLIAIDLVHVLLTIGVHRRVADHAFSSALDQGTLVGRSLCAGACGAHAVLAAGGRPCMDRAAQFQKVSHPYVYGTGATHEK